ncbi:uncharacterized protein [Nicotiana tomentosiformis]|uniref:uncharacterized protein n=1 Tax=Nicotiana tomentosiformis TaxID=4098 RepID=UPI00051ABD75|nr:uncharacterized protein LOC104102531 [Nicotiana tomentosiformis]XP_016454254.1 PREDICTED: uncharacterized protein LOC107778476 [Nicotiana tabacum]
MRRPGGHYGGGADSGADATYNSDPHTMQQQQQQIKSEHNQWRWERESPKLPTNSMSPNMFPDGQGSEASRSYYQGHRTDPRMALENQGGKDPRAQPREEDMDIGYEDNPVQPSLEGLEKKFLDDIMKLTKEQNDAEDAENFRHRERINAINAQYQEQLVALRSRHASRRDEVLRRESHARKQQYEQVALDNYPRSSISANTVRGFAAMNSPSGERQAARGFVAMNSPSGERQAAYNADSYDSYRENSRYLGSGRDHGYEPRVQYPGGRVYDTGSRYY